MLLTIMCLCFMTISLILMTINFFLSKKKNNDREKSSPFECGFDLFSSPRLPFSIQFYLISIIFLIFDVEIIIFLPMIYSLLESNLESWLYVNIYFILILILGVYLEWKEGALSWLK